MRELAFDRAPSKHVDSPYQSERVEAMQCPLLETVRGSMAASRITDLRVIPGAGRHNNVAEPERLYGCSVSPSSVGCWSRSR